jgi:hypothetical protein
MWPAYCIFFFFSSSCIGFFPSRLEKLMGESQAILMFGGVKR